MTTCTECSGSGFETTLQGQAIGRCRVCKGTGTDECQPLGRLRCTQAPGPHPNGCTYEAPSVPDAHDASEDAAERSRA